MHSLGIVQWDSTRRDHPGYPGRVSGTGPVNFRIPKDSNCSLLASKFLMQLIIMLICKDTHVTMHIPNIKMLVHNITVSEMK